jgi:ABC-2 type transport system permease protein
MSTQNSSTDTPLAPLGLMLWRQLQAELLRMWRTPSFFVATLVLPSILYSILGLSKTSRLESGVGSHVYTLASVATYGVVSVILYSFGVGIANERAQRVNVLMRATPLPASVYLLAKMVTALLSVLVTLLLLSGLAFFVGGVQ